MAKVQHLGIIPDGTRRWSRRERMPLEDAYLRALSLLNEHLSAAFEYGVSSVSLYLLSSYNLRRRSAYLKAFEVAATSYLREMLPPVCLAHSAKPVLAGNREILPSTIRESLESLLSLRCSWNKSLYLCMGYDPWSELHRAVGEWAREGEAQKTLTECLWVPVQLDLVIRTGGAMTLSDFLPLQSGYAQLVFLKELFNDFSPERFRTILNTHYRLEFHKRGV